MRIAVILSFAALAACGDLSGQGEDAGGAEDGGADVAMSDGPDGGSDAGSDGGSDIPQPDLIGGWSCIQKAGEGSATLDVNYASGGRSSAQMNMTFKEQGEIIDVVATGSGTWELVGNQLTEEITKFTIVGATANKREIRDQKLINRFEDSMEGQVSTSTVKTLDEETLIASSGDTTTTCDRDG